MLSPHSLIPGWWFQLFWKIWKSNGIIVPNIWKNKIHVPNHQPVAISWYWVVIPGIAIISLGYNTIAIPIDTRWCPPVISWFIIPLTIDISTSSTRTRRGGSCLKDIYKTFLIYRTCMRRAPAKPVRALCESGVLFHMSHLKLHFTLHASHSTLHTPHFSLHTALFPIHTSHFTLPTAHSTLHTSHSTLHTSHSTLHTALFTPHTSHCTLHTPHLISSELFSPYPSSSLLISSLLICHLSFHESLPSTTTKELACAVRQPGPCVRALCEAVAVLLSKNMTCARPR